MKKIVFLESLSKNYLNLQYKIRKNQRLIDSLKITVTILIFFLTLWAYWYFVNISSTKWYFLREQRQELEQAKFKHNITQLEVLKMEKENWDKISQKSNFWEEKITINSKVLYIPYQKKSKLSKN